MSQSEQRQSAIARGYLLANRAFSITMSLVVPVMAGYWGDERWGTEPWLMSIGAVIGFPLFLWQLISLADNSATANSQSSARSKPTDSSSKSS